ncbi:hypothetical protein [Thiomonas sp. FB-Cd]|uniref:hypothetical protein n=1 Tax=Thiomonas sp. FB-Cd TaxID=1158292 RepID=UPI0004DF4096|nr:hypothetical protein [Thiomonas sp. FB-Cd]
MSRIAHLRARITRKREVPSRPRWRQLWRALRFWRPNAQADRLLASLESAGLPALALYLGLRINPGDPLGLHGGFPWVWFGPWLAAVRYGAGYGLFGVALYGGAWAWLFDSSPAAFPGEFFLGGALVSLILGEFGSAYKVQSVRHREIQSDLTARLERTKRRLFIVKESLATLEQELTDRPMTLRDALLDLRRRLAQAQTKPQTPAGSTLPDPAAFLQLLSQSCRLIQAGIFLRKGGAERWGLVVRLGQHLPEIDTTHPLIEHVLETHEIAHIAQAGLSDPKYNEWVFAAPLRVDIFEEVDVLLAVHTMPFMAFDDINLRRLQVLASSYADFTQLELLVEDMRAAWPESPIGLQQEWAHLGALHRASGLRSYCALWMGEARLSAEVLDEFASMQPPESSWWRLQTPKGHLVLVVLMPIISGASLTAYRREMIEALEAILARKDIPKQTLGVDFYPVRHAADFAELHKRVNRQ